MKMKKSIDEIRQHISKEGIDCDKYLEDLPHDIESINELENMLSNNKDLARSYDLGRRDTLRELQKMLQEINDKM